MDAKGSAPVARDEATELPDLESITASERWRQRPMSFDELRDLFEPLADDLVEDVELV
jgi:hypothetical protein